MPRFADAESNAGTDELHKMPVTPFRFLSVHSYCRQVATAADVLTTPNSVYRPPPDAPTEFTPPDFFDESDLQHAEALASRQRARDGFNVGLDASQDHFLARLDDVTIQRWTIAGTECFRIFIDRGVALSEPFNAHYKADWPRARSFDTVFIDYKDERVPAPERVPIYLHNAYEPDVTFDEPVVYMLDKGASNYYHWICEVFPRLWARFEAPDLGRFPMLVNERNLTPFQNETLVTALGSAQLVAFPWNCARFARLYLSSFLTSGESAPRIRDWNTRFFGRNGLRPGERPHRRLYVSRLDATRRRVTNEEETWAALSRLGFERVIPGQLPVADQMNLFACAEAVVLPNGAAAANLAVTPPGALVVEFQPIVLLNPGVWTLARALGHSFGLVTTPDTRGYDPDYFVDMTIDTAKLTRVVEAGLAGRTAL